MSDSAAPSPALLRHDKKAEKAWKRAIADLRAQGVDTDAFIARTARSLGMTANEITGRFSLLPRMFDDRDETDDG